MCHAAVRDRCGRLSFVQAQSIIRYTEQVAGEVAERLGHDPREELAWWIRTAHQREAMVSEMYEVSGFDRRMGAQSSAAAEVMRSSVLSIWAHEQSHTRYLSTIRSDSESLEGTASLQGALEGWVTQNAVDGGVLGRLLIAIGSAMGQVPEFARELGEMRLDQLLRFYAELETTARMGYQRMLVLSAKVAESSQSLAELGPTFRFDVARILCEETFHESAFLEMAGWVEAGGVVSEALSAESCALALHRLCERNLTMAALQAGAAQCGPRLESDIPMDGTSGWVSDAGMGSVFARYGLAVPVHAHTGL